MRTVSAAWCGLLALFAAVMGAPAPAAAQQQKPNILFIMGDDIGWMQLASYQQGLGLGETPNLDRIANEGARFMLYCSPVLRHPAGLIQAANFRSAIAF